MEITIGKKLEGNRTEIICKRPAGNKRVSVRNFSVPADKQDEFVAEYKKQRNKLDITTLIIYFGSAIGAALLAGRLSKKFLPSLLYSFAGSIAGAIISAKGLDVYVDKSEQKLFDKYDVKEQSKSGKKV